MPGVLHPLFALSGCARCGGGHSLGTRLRTNSRSERHGVGQWTVNQWVKKAVLLSFRLSDNKLLRAGDLSFFDKVASKFANQDEDGMHASGVALRLRRLLGEEASWLLTSS